MAIIYKDEGSHLNPPDIIEYHFKDDKDLIERIFHDANSPQQSILYWGAVILTKFEGTNVKFSWDQSTWFDTFAKPLEVRSGDSLVLDAPNGFPSITCYKGEFATPLARQDLAHAGEMDPPSEGEAIRWKLYYRKYEAEDIGASATKVSFSTPKLVWPAIFDHGTAATYYIDDIPTIDKMSIDLRSDDRSYIDQGELKVLFNSIQSANCGAAPAYAGIDNAYSSNSSTLAHAYAWDRKYNIGTTVYYFIELEPGYTAPSGWVLISGRTYRVASIVMPSGGGTLNITPPIHTLLTITLDKIAGSGLTWYDSGTTTERTSLSVYYGYYVRILYTSNGLNAIVCDAAGVAKYDVTAYAHTGYDTTGFYGCSNLSYVTPNYYVMEGQNATIWAYNTGLSCAVTISAGSGIGAVKIQYNNTLYNSGASFPNGATVYAYVTINNAHYKAPSGWTLVSGNNYIAASHTINSAEDYVDGFSFGAIAAQAKTYTLNKLYGSPVFRTDYFLDSLGSVPLASTSYGNSIYYRPTIMDSSAAAFVKPNVTGYQPRTDSMPITGITLNDTNFTFNETTLTATPKAPTGNITLYGTPYPLTLVKCTWTQSESDPAHPSYQVSLYEIIVSSEYINNDSGMYNLLQKPAVQNYYRETFYDGQDGEYWSPYDPRPRGTSGCPARGMYIYMEGAINTAYPAGSNYWIGNGFTHGHASYGYYVYDQNGGSGVFNPFIDLNSRINSYGLPVKLGTISPGGIGLPGTYALSYTGSTYGTHSGGATRYNLGTASTVSLGTYTASTTAGYKYSLSLGRSHSSCTITKSGDISNSDPGTSIAATLAIPSNVSGTVTITATWTRTAASNTIGYVGSGVGGSHTGGASTWTTKTSAQSVSLGTFKAASDARYDYYVTVRSSKSNCTFSNGSYTMNIALPANAEANPTLSIPANTSGDIIITHTWSRVLR